MVYFVSFSAALDRDNRGEIWKRKIFFDNLAVKPYQINMEEDYKLSLEGKNINHLKKL